MKGIILVITQLLNIKLIILLKLLLTLKLINLMQYNSSFIPYRSNIATKVIGSIHF